MAHQFECQAPDCVFMIRAADETEIVSQVRRHASEVHDKSPPPEETIRDRMATVEA